MSARAAIQLLRPEQWIKNVFVLLPAFFAARLNEAELLWQVSLAYVAFCAASSVVYIFNDWADRERDRLHPVKKNRPRASGQLSVRSATLMGTTLLVIALFLAGWLKEEFLYILLAYIGMNIAYSLHLKNIAIIDVGIIALGFLLRVLAGGFVADVPLSHWLIVMTFLLAMILGLSKRRTEFVLQSPNSPTRPSLQGYNLAFIDQAMTLMTAVTIVAYLMYTLSEEVIQRIGSRQLYLTSFFVIIGILRYLQLAIVFQATDSPTKVLLSDRFLQVVILAWVAS
ncbi:MAG: decaprenyl-phosphate phosphoribosyltransferase, partial [Bacteroidota bacterium]